MAHMQLTQGCAFYRSMGATVYHSTTHTANAFAAIVIEGDGLLPFLGETLVHEVEHLQEGHMLADALGRKRVETAFVARPVLTPDVKCEVHYL